MPLLPGARLGPYEIVAPLGAGGMDEVYRARDGRLQREVALELLPGDAAGPVPSSRTCDTRPSISTFRPTSRR